MQADHPVNQVRWIPIDAVVANDYNPNTVARNEMALLYLSIQADGYTQPVVVIHDVERDRYVIVDGFHRYLVARTHPDVLASTEGCLPCVVLKKPINDRMASTIRHNRARGKHSIAGMGAMVFQLLDRGWDDARICAELGLEAEELARLKHVTGFSALFKDTEYSQAWESRHQVALRTAAEKEAKDAQAKGR